MKKEDFNIDLDKLIDIFELPLSENSEAYYSTSDKDLTEENIRNHGFDIDLSKLMDTFRED